MPKDNIPEIRVRGFSDEWKQRKLGEIGEVITGSTPSTQHPEYYSEDGMPWVTPTDIVDNIIYDTPRKLSPIGEKVGRVVPADTILVTCIASIGKNAMLVNTGSFNQQINSLVPDKKKYDPYFLLTESFHWSAKMKREAAAGTMQIVNKNEFSAIETYVPELSEQKAIGAYFCQIDKLITLHQHKYESLVAVKKAMLEKMFPKEGETVPEIRFAGFTDPWEQRKLANVVDSVDTGKSKFDKEGSSGEYPILGSTSVIGYDEEYDYEGDFILTARVGANAGSLYRHAGKVKISDNTVFIQASQNIEFLYQLLIQFDIKKLSFGTGQPLVKASELKSLELMMPTDMKEQMQIGAYFSELDNLIALHQRKCEVLKNLKSALLNKMFL